MSGNYDITFYSTGLCILLSGAMVIPVAKSFRCRLQPSSSSKDSLPLDSRSTKVRFQEPQEKEVPVTFPAVKDDVKMSRDKMSIYSLKEENSVPLLYGEGKVCDDVEKTEIDKLVTMYENPLSLV